MKTLRKASFENFERLTIIEASQLYGGTGDTPPTTPMPNDSTQVNKNDSVPPTTPSIPKTPPKQTVSGGVKYEPNGSVTGTVGYTITTNSGVSAGVSASHNNKTGWSLSGTFSYTIGGKKK